MEDLRPFKNCKWCIFFTACKSLVVISSVRRMIVAILKMVYPYPLC